MQQDMPETDMPRADDASKEAPVASSDATRPPSVDVPAFDDASECVLERGDYIVRRADSFDRRSQASMLIDRRYTSRGYDTEIAAALPHNPNQITLEACNGQQLFGTLTLVLDSEECLYADTLYKEEIDQFRNRGRRVCEVTRLAFEPRYGSKDVLGSLFHVAYIYARIMHMATDAFVEVNPRHMSFYVRMLGFRQIGDVRTCTRVDAPALLLHIEVAHMGAQIARHRGSPDIRDRSLYPYFGSSGEEEALAEVIALRESQNASRK